MGYARLQRAAGEVPAPVRQQLLVPELLHLRQVDRPELRQRRHGHADQRLRPRVQPRARPTTTSRTRSRRAGSTSCRGRASALYGGWQVSGILYLRSGLPLTVTQTQGVLSTGHRQPAEPDLRRPARQSDDRSLVRHVLLRAADRHHRHVRQHRARHAARTGPVQHRRLAHQEHADRALQHRDSASRRSTCSTTRSSPTRTRRSATPRWARFRRCCRTRRARCAARSSGRCSSASR